MNTKNFQDPERGQAGREAQSPFAPLSQTSESGQNFVETPRGLAALGTDFEGGHTNLGAQRPRAPLDSISDRGQGACDARTEPAPVGPLLDDAYLRLISSTVDDMESLRKATANRLAQLTRVGLDADGKNRGLGLDQRAPEVLTAGDLLEGVKELEADAIKTMERHLRASPLHPWIKESKGVGDKQAARLLAVVGDPYWNTLHGRPRTVSELWAYCGLAVIGGEAQRLRRGMRANWSTKAKTRAYLVAEAIVKAGVRKTDKDLDETQIDGYPVDNRHATSPLAQVYLDRRRATAERLHATPCVRCGPSGKPALPGSPWGGGHKQADALRVVSKELLKGLWIAARAVYAERGYGPAQLDEDEGGTSLAPLAA